MRKVAQLFISILLLQTISAFAQEKPFTIPDTLVSMDYKQLSSRFHKQRIKNNALANLYAKIYLHKSKKENKRLEKAIGYGLVGYTYKKEYEKQLIYLDSAIGISKKLNTKNYPAIFYINKGEVYEYRGKFKNALDNYLEAIQWTKNSKNEHLEYIVKHNIGLLKRKLGKYHEAKVLLKECLSYRTGKKEMLKRDSLNYLSALSELVNVYRLDNQIDSATIINKKGLVYGEGKKMQYLFKLNKAILQYYNKEYKKVIEDVDNVLPELSKPENEYFFETTYLINSYLFQAKSYEALKDTKLAKLYFKKIDSLLHETNYIVPETRMIYTSLINYYKLVDDKNQQLFYVNKLLYSDSILDSNYRYLSEKLNKNYDTPELLLQKEALIANLEEKHSNSSISVIVLLIILSIGVVFLVMFYRKQKRYQQRFEELISTQKKELKVENTSIATETSKAIGISEDIVDSILKNLEEFEKTQSYLITNITTSSLARQFKTNSKYLSKVINTYKQKSFIQYTNDLRIEFIIDKLKNENKYRLYTIKALASEAGFNTTEAFSKSFYKKTGIYPSYFVKQLEKKEEVLKH